MSTTEIALLSLLGIAIFFAIIALLYFYLRQRKQQQQQQTSSSSSLPMIFQPSVSSSLPSSSHPQRPLPLHQPSESPSSLSSFTRISPSSQVFNLASSSSSSSPSSSSPPLHPSSSSSSFPSFPPYTSSPSPRQPAIGFNLARFFSKQSAKSGSTVYLHSRDRPLQKTLSNTPSSRSSLQAYYYDPSQFRKESKDGFPVITLTSPTNSEASIPFSLRDDISTGSNPNGPSSPSPSAPASLNGEPISVHNNTLSPSLPSFSPTVQDESSSASSSTTMTLSLPSSKSPQYYPYVLQQNVPQHMFLHPSYSYTSKPSFEKQATTSQCPSDFPPTYEEAIDDAGPSNGSKVPMSHPSTPPPHPPSPSFTSSSSSSSSTSSSSSSSSSSFSPLPPPPQIEFSTPIQEESSTVTNPSNNDLNSLTTVDQEGFARTTNTTANITATTSPNLESIVSSSSSYDMLNSSGPSAPLYEESGWIPENFVGNENDGDLCTDAGVSLNAEDDPLASLSLQRPSIQSLNSPVA